MPRPFRLLGLLVLCLAQSGCLLPRRPAVLPVSKDVKKQLIEKYSKTKWRDDYNPMAEGPAKRAERNKILNELLLLDDEYYQRYEDYFYQSGATFDTAADLANLGLTAAASVIGDEELKAILAATATGVSGARTKINTNFLKDQSRFAIIATMRAERLTTLKRIQDGMAEDLTQYPLEQGLVDIQEYLYDGTIINAIVHLSQQAGSNANTAASALKNAADLRARRAAQRAPAPALEELAGSLEAEQAGESGIRMTLQGPERAREVELLEVLKRQVDAVLQGGELTAIERSYFTAEQKRLAERLEKLQPQP